MKLKQTAALIFGTLGFGVAGISLATVSSQKQKVKLKESMEYVKKHNNNKYVELLEKDYVKEYKDYGMWKKAVKEVQDSLRIDSIARTNYAKGTQMVRDSIAKANLNDTVKTVMKSVK